MCTCIVIMIHSYYCSSFMQNQYKPPSKKQKPDHAEDDELLVRSPALDDVDKVATYVYNCDGVVHSGT